MATGGYRPLPSLCLRTTRPRERRSFTLLRKLPCPIGHVVEPGLMRHVELKRRHGDMTFRHGGHVGIRMRLRTIQTGITPKINPPARINPAVIRLSIWGDVLGNHANATNRPFVETRNVDVEQAPLGRMMAEDLLDHTSRESRPATEI